MPTKTLINATKAWALRTFATKAFAADAQTTATAAQTAARSAQETADTASLGVASLAAGVESNAALIEQTRDELFVITHEYRWDGSTDGRDTFVFNGADYYKLSDDVPKNTQIESTVSIRADNGAELDDFYVGAYCYKAGGAIVVMEARKCTLQLSPTTTSAGTFTAPSTGVYAYKYSSTNYAKLTTIVTKNIVSIAALDSRISAIESTPNAEEVSF